VGRKERAALRCCGLCPHRGERRGCRKRSLGVPPPAASWGAGCGPWMWGRCPAPSGAADGLHGGGSGLVPGWRMLRCGTPHRAHPGLPINWCPAAPAAGRKGAGVGVRRGEACIDTRMCRRLLAVCRGMRGVRAPTGARRRGDGVMGALAGRPGTRASAPSGSLVPPGNRSDGLLRKRWRRSRRHRTLYCKHSPLRRTSGAGVRGTTTPPAAPVNAATWLILPVVICLSQRLSHACLSINSLYCETANGSLNQLEFI
jgi:hypothetical protein